MSYIDETIHNLTTRLQFYRENPQMFGQTLAELEALIRELHSNTKSVTQGPKEGGTSLRLVNIPRGEYDPGKRVIGFCVDQEEIPVMGLFSEQLEQYACLLLAGRGYKVEKSNGV